MSWRTVVISNRCKLDYQMGFMVVRGEETKRVFIDEIALVLIENPAVSMTGCLLEELINKKVRVIFCDSRRSPMAELAPYNGSHDCSKKIKSQSAWNERIKGIVWAEIVADKILKQMEFLYELGQNDEAALLSSYLEQIEEADRSNREGHAAKVYFNAVFGKKFTRSSENVVNAALNYGYSIILSSFNREITSAGYLTQIGIFHDNMFNHFNLSCDLMEPFRILVDRNVLENGYEDFGAKEKCSVLDILNQNVVINASKQTVLNAIKIYTRSVIDAMENEDPDLIKKYSINEL